MRCYQKNNRVYFVEEKPVVKRRMNRFIRICYMTPVYLIAALLFWQVVFVGFDKGVGIYFAHKENCKCSRVR